MLCTDAAEIFRRVATKVLLSLKVENPQKVLWMVAFLLIFGEYIAVTARGFALQPIPKQSCLLSVWSTFTSINTSEGSVY